MRAIQDLAEQLPFLYTHEHDANAGWHKLDC